MTINVDAVGISDIGLGRENNEDYWGRSQNYPIFILADGMGGHRAGEVAAREAVTTFVKIIDSKQLNHLELGEVSELIFSAIVETNERVYAIGAANEAFKGMGTTLCVLYISDEGVVWAHIGDSRIYQLHKRQLRQITRDDSLLSDMLDLGQIEEGGTARFRYKNILTKALGTDVFVEPSVEISHLDIGDRFLLCTDGLTDVLGAEDIEEVLCKTHDLNQAAKQLIELAIKRNAQDNVTVLLVDILEK